MDEPTRTAASNPHGPPGEPLHFWGPFQLIEKVGQGSFGEVYRAFDTVLQREVAVKLLLHAPRHDTDQNEALREARAIAKARHPNILAVYGIDRHDERVGFWSDFVHGQTLSSLVKAHGPFGPREVALIGIDICKALGAVHGAGLLHRDIKASNVMREAGGRILLMDFGLTQAWAEETGMCGTPPYMAPELLSGKSATVATDIYAVGVLLFHLLTGKHPVDGASFAEAKSIHNSGSRRRLMDERPDLPERTAHVIEKAIDYDPNQRFASAGEMIAALSEAAGLSSISPGPPAVRKQRKLWPVVAGLAAVILAVAYFATPVRALLPFSGTARLTGAGPHAEYLQAVDLLDRYYKPHNIENAIALLRTTTANDPNFASGFAALGHAYWLQYRDTHNPASVEPAKAACNRALQLDPDIATAHVTLGMIYTDAGRTDLAAEELKTALRLNGRGADAYSALAELYQKEGRAVDVEPNIQKAIDLAPGAWPYLNQLGNYYLSTGKYAAAAEQFQNAARQDPANARAFNNLGMAYRRQARLEDAKAAYEKSLSLDPAFNTLSNLGTLLQFEGKDQEAVPVYQRAVEMNPASYLSWANLASAYDRIPGEKAKARETYLKAISVAQSWRENQPNDPSVISDLGTFYAAVGMPENSVPLLRQATALAPKNPQVLYRVSEGYELLGRRRDALEWIAKALQAGLSLDTVKRNPDLAKLRADPNFPVSK